LIFYSSRFVRESQTLSLRVPCAFPSLILSVAAPNCLRDLFLLSNRARPQTRLYSAPSFFDSPVPMLLVFSFFVLFHFFTPVAICVPEFNFAIQVYFASLVPSASRSGLVPVQPGAASVADMGIPPAFPSPQGNRLFPTPSCFFFSLTFGFGGCYPDR